MDGRHRRPASTSVDYAHLSPKLGATYAELFPERVGRLVLDGALTPGRWAHVAYTRDGTTHRLYVDGVQVAPGGAETRMSVQPYRTRVLVDEEGCLVLRSSGDHRPAEPDP